MKKLKNNNPKNDQCRAVILFTRIPVPGKAKTRMMPYLSADECAELQRCFLKDIVSELKKTEADLIICYEPDGDVKDLEDICGKAEYSPQAGEGLGSRMLNAFTLAFSSGYSSCLLMGSDIPGVKASELNEAFEQLDGCDAVIGPSEDGGYWLIGMHKAQKCLFENRSYGHGSVLEELKESACEAGLNLGMAAVHRDMDTREDLAAYRAAMRKDPQLRRSHTGRFLKEKQSISVIVPIYNEASTIDHMIEQLEPIKEKCEILLVDGGSSDGTCDRISPDFRLIKSAKGRGAQMNAGAAASGGDVLFFLHCDSEIPRNTLSEIRRVISRYEAGCFGIAFRSKQFFMLTNRIISNGRAGVHRIMFGDQGIFMTRELFEKLGGFKEIPIMEDYDLSLRLRRMGVRTGMCHHRIYTSDRRYPKETIPKLRLMHEMYRLRQEYKRGAPADKLAERYRDIR